MFGIVFFFFVCGRKRGIEWKDLAHRKNCKFEFDKMYRKTKTPLAIRIVPTEGG